MIKEFIAVDGSTVYDVCLNTYGTLNLLAKLMLDSGHDGVNTYPVAGQVFLYDESLVNVQANQNLAKNYTITAGDAQIKFATRR